MGRSGFARITSTAIRRFDPGRASLGFGTGIQAGTSNWRGWRLLFGLVGLVVSGFVCAVPEFCDYGS